MASNSSQLPAPPSTNTPPTWKEVFDFIRDENKKDREHLNATFQRVIWATTAMLLVALAIFFYVTNKSLDEARNSIRSEVQRRLDEEFSAPELKRTIEQAARDATKRDLSDAIRSAVRAEETTVRRSFELEIAKRVQALTPRGISPTQSVSISQAIQKQAEHFYQLFSGQHPNVDLPYVSIRWQRGDSETQSYANLLSPAMTAILTNAKGEKLGAQIIVESGWPTDVFPRGISFCTGGTSGKYSSTVSELRSVLREAGINSGTSDVDSTKCNNMVVIRVGSK